MPWRSEGAFAPQRSEGTRLQHLNRPAEAYRHGLVAARCVYDLSPRVQPSATEQKMLGLVIAAAAAVSDQALLDAGADPEMATLDVALLLVSGADAVSEALLKTLTGHSIEWRALLSPLTDASPVERAAGLAVAHLALHHAVRVMRRTKRHRGAPSGVRPEAD